MSINFLRGFDNSSLDLARVLWALGVLAYVGLAAFAMHKGQSLDLVSFALGFGVIHGVGAGGTGIKDFAIAKAFSVKEDAVTTRLERALAAHQSAQSAGDRP